EALAHGGEGHPLRFTDVELEQFVARLDRDLPPARDGRGGLHRAPQRARVDAVEGLAFQSKAEGGDLLPAAFREGHIRATEAEALTVVRGLPVTDEVDLHSSAPEMPIQSRSTNGEKPSCRQKEAALSSPASTDISI